MYIATVAGLFGLGLVPDADKRLLIFELDSQSNTEATLVVDWLK